MPAIPKHPSTRARRNKVAGARTLQPVEDPTIPDLPETADGDAWHPMTLAWWADIWSSPMAPEYDESDVHGLFMLAMLVDQFWVQPSPALASEIRLQRQCFGLTPIDRRRLQWEIDRGDEAEGRTRQRRNEQRPSAADGPERPAKSARKAAWVEFAVAQGMSKAAAEKMTRDDLVAEFEESESDDPRARMRLA